MNVTRQCGIKTHLDNVPYHDPRAFHCRDTIWCQYNVLIFSCNSGSFETKVTGKQCFDCMKTSEGYDDCGNFDSATPKCNVVNETVACITSIATV